MIVKNESRIIERLLESVLPMIDCYCICDTGSTDNTVEIIETFFQNKQIPGKIVREPFRDFGYNRTFALEECDKMEGIDYVLLMDADMVLQNDSDKINEIKRQLWHHLAHHVLQGSEKFYNKNVRFVKHRSGMSYWGVTHEYVKVPDGTIYGIFTKDQLFILDVGDGGSKSDKFERDVRLLTDALIREPNNDRYTFYLANSLRDSGRTQEAIDMFKKRIKLGGWNEEIWHSWYSIGNCYKTLGNDDMAIVSWLEAYENFPERLENLYKIINMYREKGQNKLAYHFYRMTDTLRTKYPQKDYLFLEKDIYDYKLDYEMSIIGYYCNEDQYDLPKLCIQVLCYPQIEQWMENNILSNYKFYAPKLMEYGSVCEDFTENTDKAPYGFHSSTPSIVTLDKTIITNVRYVNYHIDDKGGYVQKENIESKNVLHMIGRRLGIQHDKTLDNNYVGLEDMRLISHENILFYNANRALSNQIFVIEHGEIDIETGKTKNSVLLHRTDQNNIEKNWVLFSEKNNLLTPEQACLRRSLHLSALKMPKVTLPFNSFIALRTATPFRESALLMRKGVKCIYKWHPLIIGDIDQRDGLFTDTHVIETPSCFKYFRGSTNGVHVDNEIWFICHIVSYEDRRYYYHVFVVLNADTYEIVRFSRFFTFERENVEYTLGFIYMADRDVFRIGYSTMDRTTKMMEISREKIENLMCRFYVTKGDV